MPGTTSTALPSFFHDQHHKTDAAKRKGWNNQGWMYRAITLSPNIAKLFEYVLLECFGDQLSSDEL